MAALVIRSTHIITPKKSLKFKVQNKEYKENIVNQLERITNEMFIKSKDDKVTNFSILSARKKKKVSNKRRMPCEIIDQIKIGRLQNFGMYDKINPVDISIRDSEVNSFLARFRQYKYRIVIYNLLCCSAPTNNTNVIFVSCNGLNEAKELLINGKQFKTLGVINLVEIEHRDKVKRKSKWTNASHFAFAFTTTNLHDILNLEVPLLDDEAKLINLPTKEDKVPILTFTFQIVK